MTYLYSQGIGGHHDGRMNAADKRGGGGNNHRLEEGGTLISTPASPSP